MNPVLKTVFNKFRLTVFAMLSLSKNRQMRLAGQDYISIAQHVIDYLLLQAYKLISSNE